MTSAFSSKELNILVNGSKEIRSAVEPLLKQHGYYQVHYVESSGAALRYLVSNPVDWFITPLHTSSRINALQILKLCGKEPQLRQIRMSLCVSQQEAYCLPKAFELGLLNYFTLPSRDLGAEFEQFMKRLHDNRFETTLVSASYLRKLLRERHHFHSLIAFEKKLLVHYPMPKLTLELAQTSFLAGKMTEGRVALTQATLLDPKVRPLSEKIAQRYLKVSLARVIDEDQAQLAKALGIKTVVVIDSDKTVFNTLRTDLTRIFSVEPIYFADGQKAAEWIETSREPDLVIMEWRIPKVSGPALSQRIRLRGFNRCNIVITSSLVREEDQPLLREMNVTGVIEKPIDESQFLGRLLNILQQERVPNLKKSIERKLSKLLKGGQIGAAEKLREQYVAHKDFHRGDLHAMNAAFAFHSGHFEISREEAMEALKVDPYNLDTLNILGKSFMKLGDFDSAVKCFAKAQEFSPQNIERLCNLAASRMELGDQDGVGDALANATRVDGTNKVVLEMEARSAILFGQAAKAQGLIREMDSAGELLTFLNNKAVALAQMGEFQQSIELYTQALNSLPPEFYNYRASICYNLGLAFARMEDLQLARKYLVQVLEGAETKVSPKAKSLMQRIEYAVKHNVKLNLPPPKPVLPPEGSGATMSEAMQRQFERIKFKPKDETIRICCYPLYRDTTSQDIRALELVRLIPELPKHLELDTQGKVGDMLSTKIEAEKSSRELSVNHEFEFHFKSIRKPRAVASQDLVRQILEARKQEEERNAHIKSQSGERLEGGMWLFNKRVVAYHSDASLATTLRQDLEKAGCLNVVATGDFSDVSDQVLAGRVGLIAIWFDRSNRNSLEYLRELTEVRQLPRVPIILFAPERQVLQGLKNYDYLFDYCHLFQRNNVDIRKAVDQAIAKANHKQTARSLLYRMRTITELVRQEGEATPELMEELKALSSLLLKNSRFRYVVETEIAAFYIASGNLEKANDAVAKIRNTYQQTFETLILSATVRAKMDHKIEGADQLIDETLQYQGLTVLRCQQVGALLLEWGAWLPLRDLLEEWEVREYLPKNATLDFLHGVYYLSAREPEAAKPFLMAALASNPLNDNYVIALKDCAHQLKDAKLLEAIKEL